MLGGIGIAGLNMSAAPAILKLTSWDIEAMARRSLESAQRSKESYEAALREHPNDAETPELRDDIERMRRWVETLELAVARVAPADVLLTYAQLRALQDEFGTFKTYAERRRERDMDRLRENAAQLEIPIS